MPHPVLSLSFQHGNTALLEIPWSHCVQCSQWRTSLCSCCCNIQAPTSLEMTSRKSNHTWLRAIQFDLIPLNTIPSYAGKRNPLKNNGIQLWSRLRSRREHHEETETTVPNIFLVHCPYLLYLLAVYHDPSTRVLYPINYHYILPRLSHFCYSKDVLYAAWAL